MFTEMLNDSTKLWLAVLTICMFLTLSICVVAFKLSVLVATIVVWFFFGIGISIFAIIYTVANLIKPYLN